MVCWTKERIAQIYIKKITKVFWWK